MGDDKKDTDVKAEQAVRSLIQGISKRDREQIERELETQEDDED